MESFGAKLKAIRTHWQLSLKEVEERSVRLAQQWGKPSYGISASWLHRVETEDRDISAMKLIVLAALYNLSSADLLALCPESAAAPGLLEPASAPNSTILLPGGPLQEHSKSWLPDQLVTSSPPETTKLLPVLPGSLPPEYRRAVIGLDDRTLEPMVLAGSYMLIDTSKRLVVGRREWNNEFDRPIYFLLTRAGYLSGFCELDKSADWLTLVPHPLSFASTRRWRYKKEVEVIGTVAAYSMKRVA